MSAETEDRRTPHEVLRDLYTALICDVNTVQRRRNSGAGIEMVGSIVDRMQRCIQDLEPLIDRVRELEG